MGNEKFSKQLILERSDVLVQWFRAEMALQQNKKALITAQPCCVLAGAATAMLCYLSLSLSPSTYDLEPQWLLWTFTKWRPKNGILNMKRLVKF